mmetsp:Transcript_9503/g.15457  ORF Transcript_9503/g.15457 Transcript_9503/m.15457 type:complete len:86 (+) Transcript_9503:229-486(+)
MGPHKIRNEKNELTLEALSLLVQNQEGRHHDVDPKQEFPWTYQCLCKGHFTHKSKGSLTGRRQGPARKGLALQAKGPWKREMKFL